MTATTIGSVIVIGLLFLLMLRGCCGGMGSCGHGRERKETNDGHKT